MRLLLIILLIMLLLGTLPTWPYSANWGLGYYPTGLFSLFIIILVVMALVRGPNRIPPV